jgi:hypothetical protein
VEHDLLYGHGQKRCGKLVNGGQQITREEAIRLYTVNNGWFLKEEANLGSIEASSATSSY